MDYDVDTIKQLVKLAQQREAGDEVVSFLLDFLETVESPKNFEGFLTEIGQAG